MITMKTIIKKIYTILVLITNTIIRRKHYKLHFVAENNPPIKFWYYDFKHWGFEKHNLLMVSGADDLCELYANGKDEVTVDIIASKKPLEGKHNYDHYVADEPIIFSNRKLYERILDKILYGRNYTEDISAWKKSGSHTKPRHFWICPVTLFVLGRYPKHIYIKRK